MAVLYFHKLSRRGKGAEHRSTSSTAWWRHAFLWQITRSRLLEASGLASTTIPDHYSMLRELPHWNLKKKDYLLLAVTQHFWWGVQEGVLDIYAWMAELIIICLLSIGNLSERWRLWGRCGNVLGRIMRRESRPDRTWREFARWVSIMLLFRSGGGGAGWVLGRYRKDSQPGCCEGVWLFRGGKWSLCASSVWLALSRGSRSKGPERALWKGVVKAYAAYGQL